MRPRRLIVTFLATLLLVFLSACTAAPAAGEATPSPTVPDPAPTITPEPLHTAWALHWRAQAVKNRRPLPRLAYCLSVSKPTVVPARPSLTASQRVWSRYGQRCKTLAVEYVKDAKRLRQRLWHPVIRNYTNFRPLVRWYFDRGEDAIALPILRDESGGSLAASNGPCQGPWQLHSCWWRGKFHINPHDPVASTRVAAWLQNAAGWDSWAVWPACMN